MKNILIDDNYNEDKEELSGSKIGKYIKYILIIGTIIFLIIFLITKKETEIKEEIEQTSNIIFMNEYNIGKQIQINQKLYGLVVSDNLVNVMNSVGGVISNENCQPGKKVFAGEILYEISSSNDVTTKNAEIQLSYTKQQIDNLNDIISNTQSNFDIQEGLLSDQMYVNNKNYTLFSNNLENLRTQKNLNSNDMDVQIENSNNQLELLYKSQDQDLKKLENNLSTFKYQIKNSVSDAMRKLDNIFGISDSNSNSSYDKYLSANNLDLKSQIKSEFYNLNNKISDITNMNDDYIQQYLQDLGLLFQKATEAVNASIVGDTLAQTSINGPSIDGYYTIFYAYSNSFFTSKTNYETLSSAYQTAKNNYSSQITTLKNNINTFDENKSESANITFQSNINSMQSQINNINLATESLGKQIENLNNTKSIQLSQFKSQYLNLQQSYEILVNNLGGEIISSPIDGIVKIKQANQNNKVAPNMVLCQISSNNLNKIQIYSPFQIEIGKKIILFDGNEKIDETNIQYQLPQLDNMTQNYIYETIINNSDLIDGKKLSIAIESQSDLGNILIPLDFIQPKLDGYYVYVKVQNNEGKIAAYNKKIEVGEIDNGFIKVLSGLEIGNIILK